MKRVYVFAVMLAALLVSVSAHAEVREFTRLSLNVPDGWTASESDETVTLIRSGNTASMTVTIAPLEGHALKEYADAFVEALKGRNLEAKGNSYIFDMTNEHGVGSKGILSGDDENFCLLVMTGIEAAGGEFSAIIDSLTQK